MSFMTFAFKGPISHRTPDMSQVRDVQGEAQTKFGVTIRTTKYEGLFIRDRYEGTVEGPSTDACTSAVEYMKYRLGGR